MFHVPVYFDYELRWHFVPFSSLLTRVFLYIHRLFLSPNDILSRVIFQLVQCQTFMYVYLPFFLQLRCLFVKYCFATNSFCVVVCLCSHLLMVQLPIYQTVQADLLLLPIPDSLVLLLLVFMVGLIFFLIYIYISLFCNLHSITVFLRAGNLQGLHNLHGSYNLQGTLSSRNSSMNSLPSPGVQQPNGSFSSGRFASSNLPAPLSQVNLGFKILWIYLLFSWWITYVFSYCSVVIS